MPTVWTNVRRVSMAYLPPFSPAVVVAGRSTLRNTSVAFFISSIVPIEMRAVGLLERREVAADHHARLGAGVAELLRGPADVHEDEVALRVGRLAARGPASALTVNARTSVLRARSSSMCFGSLQRRDRRGDAEHADVVRHLQPRERLHDRVGLPDRVADPHAGHAVRLRERARDEDVGRRERQRNRRLVRRVGHVVVIRLVDQDHRVRRRLPDALDEVGHGLRAVDGRRRVVRVVEEDQAGALSTPPRSSPRRRAATPSPPSPR